MASPGGRAFGCPYRDGAVEFDDVRARPHQELLVDAGSRKISSRAAAKQQNVGSRASCRLDLALTRDETRLRGRWILANLSDSSVRATRTGRERPADVSGTYAVDRAARSVWRR